MWWHTRSHNVAIKMDGTCHSEEKDLVSLIFQETARQHVSDLMT